MVKFCNDTDILKYEPVLFGELSLPNQVLISGEGGQLIGTSFTASGADFGSAGVSAGQVANLRSADGCLDGGYEIVSVDSATQLTVSVVRSQGSASVIAPPAANDVSYRVVTFEPQICEVGFELTEYFGIAPGNPASETDAEDLLDSSVLKGASVFGVISVIYTMLASRRDDENFWAKSLHYRKLFEKARERCRLSIDSGSDGIADVTKIGGDVRLRRD